MSEERGGEESDGGVMVVLGVGVGVVTTLATPTPLTNPLLIVTYPLLVIIVIHNTFHVTSLPHIATYPLTIVTHPLLIGIVIHVTHPLVVETRG